MQVKLVGVGLGMLLVLATPWTSKAEMPVRSQSQKELTFALTVAQSTRALSDALDAKVEKIIEGLEAENYTGVVQFLSPELQADISPTAIEQSWTDLQSFLGPFQKLVDIRIVNAIDYDVAIATLEFGKSTEEILLVFDREQQLVAADVPRPGLSIEAIAEQFISAIVAGDYTTARTLLHPQLKVAIAPSELQRRWEALQSRAGQYQNRRNTRIREGNDFDVVSIELEFTEFVGDVVLIFDSAGRISGFDMEQF
ncbi:MAG: DUF3887 domain-containing protein [Spirulina sp.]